MNAGCKYNHTLKRINSEFSDYKGKVTTRKTPMNSRNIAMSNVFQTMENIQCIRGIINQSQSHTHTESLKDPSYFAFCEGQ